jgi:hypothetical protein
LSPDGRFGAVLVGVALALGLFGYFVGHSGAPTDAEVAKARAKATASAERTSEKRAYSAARRRGAQAGVEEGRRAGTSKGRSDGKKKTQEVNQQTPAGSTGSQTGGQTDYSTAPQNGVTDTPSANSPEGRKLLEESPDCQNVPPPPPGYDGPVQC